MVLQVRKDLVGFDLYLFFNFKSLMYLPTPKAKINRSPAVSRLKITILGSCIKY